MDNQPRWYTLYAHEKEMPQPPMPPSSSSAQSRGDSSRRQQRQSSAGAGGERGSNQQHAKSQHHRHSKDTPNANGGAAGKEQQQWSLGGCGTAASQSDSSCSTVNTDFLSEEQRESVRRWLGPGQLLLIGEATRTERGGDLPDDQLVSGELFLDLRLSAESNDGGRLRVTPRQCRNLVAAAAGLHCCCELSLLGTARARRRTRAQRLGLSGVDFAETMEFDSQQLAAARSATSGLLLLQATLLSGKVSASSELGGGEIKGPGRRRLGEAVICVDDCAGDAGGGRSKFNRSCQSMNGRQTLSGRKPHGRLDCDYAISGLLKAQPMFDFGQLDRMKPQAPRCRHGRLADPAPGGRCRRLVAPSDWVWKQPESSEFESRPRDERRQAWHRPCSNNSAARAPAVRGPIASGSELSSDCGSCTEISCSGLANTWLPISWAGSGASEAGRFICSGFIIIVKHIAGFFMHVSQLSIRARMLGPLPREVFNESGRSGAAASKGRLTPDSPPPCRLCSSGATTRHNRNNSSNRAGVDLVQLTLTLTGRRKNRV
uniref:RING-type domain-containing protein n=1 Tax=Macrostomum lignano TaxID=282301 RepID=A0A1I8IZ86_9PLAT